jgi:hypothetical protein
MRDAIHTLLSNDSTLMATLVGGLYDAADVGEISRQETPSAFDANGEIQPCGLLRFGTIAPTGPYLHGARLSFSIYLYELQGYTDIETVRARVYALLQQATVTPAAGGCWEIRHTDDVLDTRDSALECSLAVSRFEAVIRRA